MPADTGVYPYVYIYIICMVAPSQPFTTFVSASVTLILAWCARTFFKTTVNASVIELLR